jgi:hypothetical protein
MFLISSSTSMHFIVTAFSFLSGDAFDYFSSSAYNQHKWIFAFLHLFFSSVSVSVVNEARIS